MIKLVLEKRVFWWIVVAAAVIAGGVLSVDYTVSGFGACGNAVLNTIPSPDGSRVIVIFRKECNATVPYSTQASIAPTGLTSPAEKVPPFFIIAGTPTITATWRGNRAVDIVPFPAGDKIFRNQQSVGDIKIEYK